MPFSVIHQRLHHNPNQAVTGQMMMTSDQQIVSILSFVFISAAFISCLGFTFKYSPHSESFAHNILFMLQLSPTIVFLFIKIPTKSQNSLPSIKIIRRIRFSTLMEFSVDDYVPANTLYFLSWKVISMGLNHLVSAFSKM